MYQEALNKCGVLSWFNSSENKETLSFICFHVCDFYPSINEKLLSKALDFASEYRPISRHERDIILHAKCSLLFSNDSSWDKKSSNNLFNVTMGSFDGAETCKLVGCYMLSARPSSPKSMAKTSASIATTVLHPSTKCHKKLKRSKRNCAKTFRANDHGGTVKKHSFFFFFFPKTINTTYNGALTRLRYKY